MELSHKESPDFSKYSKPSEIKRSGYCHSGSTSTPFSTPRYDAESDLRQRDCERDIFGKYPLPDPRHNSFGIAMQKLHYEPADIEAEYRSQTNFDFVPRTPDRTIKTFDNPPPVARKTVTSKPVPRSGYGQRQHNFDDMLYERKRRHGDDIYDVRDELNSFVKREIADLNKEHTAIINENNTIQAKILSLIEENNTLEEQRDEIMCTITYEDTVDIDTVKDELKRKERVLLKSTLEEHDRLRLMNDVIFLKIHIESKQKFDEKIAMVQSHDSKIHENIRTIELYQRDSQRLSEREKYCRDKLELYQR